MRGERALTKEDLFRWRWDVGQNLRCLRESRCLTQDDVAFWLGWSRTTVLAIERGQQAVTLDQLVQVLRLLKGRWDDVLRATIVAPREWDQVEPVPPIAQQRPRRRR